MTITVTADLDSIQSGPGIGGSDSVSWVHHNPITGSYQTTDSNQRSIPGANLDSAGVDVGSSPAQEGNVRIDPTDKAFWATANQATSQQSRYLNGLQVGHCSLILQMVESGAASFAPWQSVVPAVFQGQRTAAFFHAYADGYEGYVPASAVYAGDGKFSFIGPPLPRGYYHT